MRKSMMAIALSLAATSGTAWAGGATTTTTSTTTLPPACDDAETFDSTLCRLDELATDVAAQPELGPMATKLGGALSKARSNVNLARGQCDESDAKTAGKRLKKAIRRLIQYGHRLRGLKARKTIPDEIRTPYVDRGVAIQRDVEGLKDGLSCPSSPSGAFLSR